MSKLLEVIVPLVNPNETDALLASLNISEGHKIQKGEVIATFETTKSTLELTAEKNGFILGLRYRVGATIRAGERLCFIADTANLQIPAERETKVTLQENEHDALPSGLRITQPALALAKQRNVNLLNLPRDVLITEKKILELSGSTSVEPDPRKIVIFGGGGHAKSLIDLIRSEGKYKIEGILDDAIPTGTMIMDVPVLGGGEMLASLKAQGISQAVNAVGGIGSITPRLQVFQKLAEAGISVVTVKHPLSYVEPTAKVADGCQLFYHAYIGSEVKIGFGCIVNTGAIISHDCVLDNYVNLSPGAILAGAVLIGERSLIGMGVTVNLGVRIGAGARIGNSAVVKSDIPENGIVRAGTVWPQDD